jgi:hypothetical protein
MKMAKNVFGKYVIYTNLCLVYGIADLFSFYRAVPYISFLMSMFRAWYIKSVNLFNVSNENGVSNHQALLGVSIPNDRAYRRNTCSYDS